MFSPGGSVVSIARTPADSHTNVYCNDAALFISPTLVFCAHSAFALWVGVTASSRHDTIGGALGHLGGHSAAHTHDRIRFEWTTAAATHNLAIIRRYGGNLRTPLAAQPFSTLSPGSEFRLAHQLAPLLLRHPFWAAFAELSTNGAEFPLVHIPDAEQLSNVTATLARGNHKSVRGHEAKLLEMLKDEVKQH